MNQPRRVEKPKRGDEIEVIIDSIAFGGRGIARIPTEKGDLVAFIPNTISGQVVKAKIIKARRNHLECKLMAVLEPSPSEVVTPYQCIAGAPYATLPIPLQKNFKRDTSFDLFRKIGDIKDPAALFDEFIPSPSHWHYRNKMEYSFAAIRYDLESGNELDDFALGFKHRGTWWMVENLDKDSGLFDAEVENQLHKIRHFCQKTGLPAWHAPKRKGFFRFLTVRKSHANNRLLFNLVTTSVDLEKFDIKSFVAFLHNLFAERLAGIIHTLNDDMGDRVQPLEGSSKLIFGKDYITETLSSLKFDISMASFFQTNPGSAERLYAKAISYLQESVKSGCTVLDLFCGTGTISQLVGLAMPESEVIGVEIEERAVRDARRSAKQNEINNVKYFAADVGKFLVEHPEYTGKIEAIIMDPPRGGIAPKSLKRAMDLKASTLIYISCNPATLSRDIRVMAETGYTLQKFSLVDQFPHTSHVEAVALFKN